MKHRFNKNNYQRNNKPAPQPQGLKVEVRGDDVNKALRLFKKKVSDSGLLQTLREKEFYEKPTTKRRRKKAAGIARNKKRLRLEQEQYLRRPKRY